MIPKQNLIKFTCILAVVAFVVVCAAVYYNNHPPKHLLPSSPPIKVLFIGNSFTSVNDLPAMVAQIATSLGDTVIHDMSAPGGYTFAQHTTNQDTLNKIRAQAWDFVVLQEQSELPTNPAYQVAQFVTPYAIQLNNDILQANPKAKTVFYETWGYKNGDTQFCPTNPAVCTYKDMQERLNNAYQMLATQTSAKLAPVGEAWSLARKLYPNINLYQSDDKHPSEQGTYLAACVFYVTLFNKPVVGAAALDLSKQDAAALQQIAQELILKN
jgi:hypothetical protein